MKPSPLSLEAAEQAMHWQLELQSPDVSEQTRNDWLAWRKTRHMNWRGSIPNGFSSGCTTCARRLIRHW